MRIIPVFALAALAALPAACGGPAPEETEAEISGTEREPAMETMPADDARGRETRSNTDDTRAAAAENAPDAQAVLAGFGGPYTEADLSNGERLWRRCTSCHTIEADAPHRVGPNLHGLFARTVGTADGFRYSSALQEAGFEWTPDQLERWLADPRGFLPGNRMSFAGLRNVQDRHDLIAWMAVESAE